MFIYHPLIIALGLLGLVNYYIAPSYFEKRIIHKSRLWLLRDDLVQHIHLLLGPVEQSQGKSFLEHGIINISHPRVYAPVVVIDCPCIVGLNKVAIAHPVIGISYGS